MKQLNIKEYVAAEKEKLKNLPNTNKIKLGIIDGTAPDDAANAIYIQNTLNDFTELGWEAVIYKVHEQETSCHDAIIRAINHNCNCIMIQLPVRSGVTYDPMMIPRGYDCDGFRFDSFVNPVTPQGIIDYLEACEFPFSGKTAVVLGRSNIVGKPIVRMLTDKDMTVSLCHSKSDPSIVSGLLCDADLVVCATGKPHLIVRDQCMRAVVADVGITRQDNKIVGDFEEKPWLCSDTVWSTPVPGGVGLLTRLALMKNCAKLVEGG